MFHWFYGPLVYVSVVTIIPSLDASIIGNEFIAALVVLIIFFVLILVELIAYKVAQREEENVWKKWIEFFMHYMVAGTMALVGVYSAKTDTTLKENLKYVIPNVFTGLFFIIYVIKYKFAAKVV
ncbi:MAG: hypothetical protein KDD45_06315 [Bdellovibrionales bacterium]|nr:hypothetical protein [Bdellovibrionales bacterium]